ncbi:MAG: D-alanyl-D-alanine carboxypeptidase [Gammaproteobacteria bacterium]|jgi:D-alanyl-D-alanine carboxypeptidase (penicillin-binding protein 5/6)
MRRIWLFLVLFFVVTPSFAAAMPIPAPPSFKASSYILMDANSGKILAEKNADKRVEPASITKIMTAYVLYKSIQAGRVSLNDEVTISKKAWRQPGSRMFVEVGTKVKLDALLHGMLIQSGNDAAMAIAQHVAGTEGAFVDLMNAEAKAMGLTGTHYADPTGLPNPKHYTTARDIAVLTRHLIHDFPQYYKLESIKEYTYNNIKQYNRNRLLWRDPSVDGVKTGHTESAGYCLVGSAKRDGMRLISVVLGTPSEDARADDSYALLNWGYRFYATHKLYGADQPLTEARVWEGSQEKVALGLTKPLFVTIPRGSYNALKASMDVNTEVQAPVKKGQKMGDVKISLDGKPVKSVPLVALKEVPEGGIVRRVTDMVLRLFH